MNGFVRERGSTFTAYWSSTDASTGQRRQHSKGGFRTKTAARQHLNAIIGAVQDGTWRGDKALTVRELLEDHWLPAQRSRGLRASTLAQYRNVVACWVVPHLGGVKAAGLTPRHVDELNAALAKLSPRSRQLSVGILKAACKWAAENGYLARSPVAGVQRPRVEQHAVEPWTVEEARSFLAATAGDRLAFAWALLLTRGLRRGELCGLRWEDVDLDSATLRLTRTRVVVDGMATDSTPKTRAGVRSIPLDAKLVAVLRQHWATQAAEKLAAGAVYRDPGWLLCDELGSPVHPDTLSGWLDKRIALTGLRRIRLHDARHTAASLMLASGVPVKVVSEMLGHASPTITLSIYAHVMPGMAEAAGAALSESLLG
ncbi:MAG: site-specific integrase [Acidimicrobiales bacterium]